MKYYHVKMLFVFVISMLVIQSCSDDTELLSIDNASANGDSALEGPRNGGGQNQQNLNSETVEKWMDLFLEIDRYATGMRPNSTARAIAYINLAAYETAVPGMRKLHSNKLLLTGIEIDEDELPRRVDYQIALNKAYSLVIDHFILTLPDDQRAKIAILESEEEERLSKNTKSQEVEDSKSWGSYVAQQIIAYSQTDDEGEKQILEPQPLSYEPPTGDGYWTYSAEPERALFPYWESVRTFVASTSETTTVPPVAYSEDPSSNYYQQMTEVYNANNDALAQDGEQLWIAEFWSDDVENLVFSPPARQVSIANQLIDKYRLDLDEALHLLVKVGFALNDAAVSTWKYKYEHMVMRPSVFVQEFIDPSYQTNLYRLIPWPNPTFPGYPSGHSCFASAAGGVFISFFGDNTNFTDRSHEGRTEFRGTPRKFKSFSDMAYENAFSRIPLGVHIEMDCSEGLRLGYEIADAINEYDLSK